MTYYCLDVKANYKKGFKSLYLQITPQLEKSLKIFKFRNKNSLHLSKMFGYCVDIPFEKNHIKKYLYHRK